MSSRRCWSDTRSGSSSAWPWARSSLLRRWVLKARNICYFRFRMFTTSGPISCLGQAGEDGVQGQEHAGPPSSGTLHHRATRSLLHRAVDGRIRLPEPHQVSARMKLKLGFRAKLSDQTAWFCRSAGSRSESARRGRISRGRGSCWGRGSRPLWLRHL